MELCQLPQSPRVPPGQVVDDGHAVAMLEEQERCVGADEPGPAGDQKHAQPQLFRGA